MDKKITLQMDCEQAKEKVSELQEQVNLLKEEMTNVEQIADSLLEKIAKCRDEYRQIHQ